jgi:DNA-binding NtrC family response regulator
MSRKIAVIDDSPEILELLKIVLENEGYRVELFLGPEIDLEALKKSAFDLIMFDLLPGKDKQRHQFVYLVRQDPQLCATPLIWCTAWEALVKKIEDWMVEQKVVIMLKPFELNDLLDIIETALGQKLEPGYKRQS